MGVRCAWQGCELLAEPGRAKSGDAVLLTLFANTHGGTHTPDAYAPKRGAVTACVRIRRLPNQHEICSCAAIPDN